MTDDWKEAMKENGTYKSDKHREIFSGIIDRASKLSKKANKAMAECRSDDSSE